MARARSKNPYARPLIPAGQAPNANQHSAVWVGPGRYAVKDVPESTDPEYTLGYSPELVASGSATGAALPDDIRIGHREPPPNKSTDPKWNAVQSSDYLRRHAVEVHREGRWETQQRKIPAPRMPLWEQERPPTRPTATQTPVGGLMTRPWHIPRNRAEIEGDGAVLHFSMADHKRNYPIMQMEPQGRLGMNTYRADPRPWDESLYYPPRATNAPNGIAGNMAYRLT